MSTINILIGMAVYTVGAGMPNMFGIPMVWVCSVFQWLTNGHHFVLFSSGVDKWRTELLTRPLYMYGKFIMFIIKMVQTSQKFGFPMVRNIGNQKNGSHLVFGPLENRTSKCLVFQCVWYSLLVFKPPMVFGSPQSFRNIFE